LSPSRCNRRRRARVAAPALSVEGAEPVTLAAGQVNAFSIAASTEAVYWTNNGSCVGSDGGDCLGSVAGVAQDGGAVTTIVTGLNAPLGIVVDDTSIYWADNGLGAILKVALTGGPVVTLAAAQNNPNFVAVDGTSVYWTNGGGGVFKVTPK
jgi:hypothetical protein